jgi:protein-S-isoprenylcysteine O-methyltransferase Ste14
MRFLHARMGLPLAASLAEWALFTLYWSHAAKNSSAAVSSESRTSRRVHEALVNVALLLVALPLMDPSRRLLPHATLLDWAGLMVQTAALLLALWARRHLGSNWSGEIAIKGGQVLVRSGPYRFVRHPIYTAILGMFVGTALVNRSALVLPGLAMAGFAYWRKIRLEEAAVGRMFGPEYARYRQSTGSLLPKLPR